MDPPPPPLPVIDYDWSCIRCGFGLRKFHLDAFCPVCGFPVAASVPDRAGYLTPRGVRCHLCSYDLAGLDRREKCPECAFAIERSIRGDLLIDASPKHVGRLYYGAVLVLIGAVIPLILAIGGLISAGLSRSRVGAGSGPPDCFFITGGLAAYLAFFGGWLLLTSRDPHSFTPKVNALRRATRVTISFVAAVAGIAIFYTFAEGLARGLLPYSVRRAFESALRVSVVVGAAVFLSSMILSMIYLRIWARRIPDLCIGRRARLFIWLWPGIVIFYIGAWAFTFLFAFGGMGARSGMFIALGVIQFIVPVVFFALYIDLFTRITRALHKVRADERFAHPPPTHLAPPSQ